MRIVMLGPFGLHPKGTMRARAVPAARALAMRGHHVTVIMPPWHTPEEAGRKWIDRGGRVEIEYISLDGLRLPALGHLIVGWRMARRALALEPDVVHAFKPKAYSGLAATLLWLRVPMNTLRGGETQRSVAPETPRSPARPAIVIDTDDWEGPGGWNTIEPYSRPMRLFFTWQERWGLSHSDAVTVASRALEALAWSLGAPPHSVTYLPNAVDDSGGEVQERSNGSARTSSAPPTIILYTRFHDHDVRRPLEVLLRARRRVPGARLIVAGSGLFGEQEDLLKIAAEIGLADAVEAVGWVEPEAAAALFQGADVAIAPFDDTLVNRTRSSMKLIDLLAAGVPVVAEAVGEASELIADGRTGRLVPPGDTEAFAEAVVDTLLDPPARAEMGRAAASSMMLDHVWSRRVERLEAAYRQAIEARESR